MKTKIALIVIVVLMGCNKDLEISEQFQPVIPVSPDADAGTWDMIVLTAPNQIPLPAPLSINDPAYIQELNAIKNIQRNLTADQKQIISYWSAGGVVRWNQFLRELVARYNLPPAPLADGTYPIPDPENPFGDPAFPFANPPYAARAYSYFSVAQYEALKATWHYKHLYNRAAPFEVDNEIKQFMPASGVPAYPSEDAVLSGVAVELLKNLFPAAVAEITLKAAQQRNAALWSGKAAPSDIAAGLSFGKAIVTQGIMPRAATDGMRNAAGNPALWKQLETNGGFGEFAKVGEKCWTSQESPSRPPMLPAFGQVLGWNMSATDFVNNRPVAPPSTNSERMREEANEVKWFAENVTRERLSIVHRWADGVGTYTPPGHWDDIATEFIIDARYSQVRAARAYALLNMALHDAAVGCWETKFFYFNPRPSQLDPSIKTCTGLPNFPSYTSGHSTFSGAAATVLSHLFPASAQHFSALAQEASLSRLYGGIHFRSDIELGLNHGQTIGGFTVGYALADGAD